MAQDEEVKRKAIIRAAILRGGFKFIRLNLIKMSMRRISAVETVNPIPVTNEATGKTGYEYVKGAGKIVFEDNEFDGTTSAEVLDTPKNRTFLASHYDEKIWNIEDEAVDREIRTLSRKIASEFAKPKPEVAPESETIPATSAVVEQEPVTPDTTGEQEPVEPPEEAPAAEEPKKVPQKVKKGIATIVNE